MTGDRADLPAGGHVHTCTLASPLPPPPARVLPSRLSATAFTEPAWPVSGPPTCRWVATPHSRTVPTLTAAGQGPAVPAERYRGRADAAAEGGDTGTAGHIPQPHGAIVAAAGQRRRRPG